MGTTATVTGLGAGTYTLTVHDNCTTLTCSQTITQPNAMSMGSCSHTNTTCGANNGSVTAGTVSNANGAVSYSWTNASNQVVGTAPIVNGLAAGTYTLTVRDNCGSLTCSQTIQPSYAMTMANCSHTDPSCSGHNGSVSAGAISNATGGVMYTWYNSSNHVVGNSPMVYGLGAGTYTLSVHDNCTTLTCSQTLVPSSTLTMGSCSHTNTTCGGNNGSVTAGQVSNANGSVSYSWANSSHHVVGTTPTVHGLPAGTYTLTVHDNCGSQTCSQTINTSGSISCSITSHPTGGCNSTGGNPEVIYLGYGPQTTQLVSSISGNGPYTYSWSPATNLSCANCASPLFTPTAAGMYTFTLTAKSVGGCTTTCDITICVLDIRVSANRSGNNSSGMVYLCQPSNCGGASQTISVNVNQVAHYMSAYHAQLGSCNQSCGSNRSEQEDMGLTTSGTTSGFELLVYPNPFASQFHLMVQSESTERIDMRIFSITGQLISETNGMQTNIDFTLGNQFSAGAYFVEVNQGDVKKVLRMIKTEYVF